MFPPIPRYAAPEYRTDPEAMAAHGFSEAERPMAAMVFGCHGEFMGYERNMNGDIHNLQDGDMGVFTIYLSIQSNPI